MTDQSFHDKIFPEHSCPTCHGVTGYKYQMKIEIVQECTWDGKPRGFDPISSTESKQLECLDCGAVFRRSTIEKLTGGAV